VTHLSDAAARYGAVALGLLIGTAAKYGVAINEGQTPTWRTLIADCLMLGMLGLIAVVAGDLFALTNQNARVFVGALAALLSARLIKMVRDKAFHRAEQVTTDYLGPPEGVPIRKLYETPPPADIPPDMRRQIDKLDT
jgi:predicted alpha/beta hydrolase